LTATTLPTEFWDALAPHHWAIENSYLDLPSLRLIQPEIRPPVLVVGAGQGLIVGALQQQGLACDGVDLSTAMIRYARLRRGLVLVHADAKALPFGNETYKTVICATGVIDFMSDDDQIRAALGEARRVTARDGHVTVAFCKFSAATEAFLIRLGLLRNHVLAFRELFEIYRMTPRQTIAWVAQRADASYLQALGLALRFWAGSSWQEKRNGFHMRRAFGGPSQAAAIIRVVPEHQPYRDEAEIRNLFRRLAVPIAEFRTSGSCHLVRL
jgi:ubiquinone/menaquinone biosynthesis C-methylase UbiE